MPWLKEMREHGCNALFMADREATALASRVLLVLNANLYCVQSYEAFVKCWSRFFSQCAQRFQDAAADCAMFSRAGVTALHTAGLRSLGSQQSRSRHVLNYNYYYYLMLCSVS